eukprot:4353165-Prymnesium_polylepis.1
MSIRECATSQELRSFVQCSRRRAPPTTCAANALPKTRSARSVAVGLFARSSVNYGRDEIK